MIGASALSNGSWSTSICVLSFSRFALSTLPPRTTTRPLNFSGSAWRDSKGMSRAIWGSMSAGTNCEEAQPATKSRTEASPQDGLHERRSCGRTAISYIIDEALSIRGTSQWPRGWRWRSEEHTSELQSLAYLVCRLLLEKKKIQKMHVHYS